MQTFGRHSPGRDPKISQNATENPFVPTAREGSPKDQRATDLVHLSHAWVIFIRRPKPSAGFRQARGEDNSDSNGSHSHGPWWCYSLAEPGNLRYLKLDRRRYRIASFYRTCECFWSISLFFGGFLSDKWLWDKSYRPELQQPNLRGPQKSVVTVGSGQKFRWVIHFYHVSFNLRIHINLISAQQLFVELTRFTENSDFFTKKN